MHLDTHKGKKRERNRDRCDTNPNPNPELSSVFFVSKISNLEPRGEGSSYRGAKLAKLTR